MDYEYFCGGNDDPPLHSIMLYILENIFLYAVPSDGSIAPFTLHDVRTNRAQWM